MQRPGEDGSRLWSSAAIAKASKNHQRPEGQRFSKSLWRERGLAKGP